MNAPRARPGRRSPLFAALAAGLSLASCGILEGVPDTQSRLDEARRLWVARGVEDYVFTYRRQCGECLPVWTLPYRVTVREGVVAGVAEAQSGEEAPLDYGRTVEALFDLVQDLLDRGAWKLSVAFDPDWGYPVTLSVDEDREMVDDEFVVHARDLVPLF